MTLFDTNASFFNLSSHFSLQNSLDILPLIKSPKFSVTHGANSFIQYFIFFPSIVKDELAVLQQRATAQKTTEPRITYSFSLFILQFVYPRLFPQVLLHLVEKLLFSLLSYPIVFVLHQLLYHPYEPPVCFL